MNHPTTHEMSGVSLRRAPGPATVALGLLSAVTLTALPPLAVAHDLARVGRVAAAVVLVCLALAWLLTERTASNRRPWDRVSTVLLWVMTLATTLPMHALLFTESTSGAIVAGGLSAAALAAFLITRWR